MPTPIAYATSPVPRPCSHLSSPASPLSTSRLASPAFNRSPATSPSLGRLSSAWNICKEKRRCRPSFGAGITWSGDWTARAAASEVDGPYRHLRRRGVCGEELVLSVATSADPIPEVDARKASEIASGNEEQRLGCRTEGDGELMSSKK